MNKQALTEHLKVEEGLRLKPYKDTMGYLTIGIGRCLDTQGISEKEAEYLLSNDIDKVWSELKTHLPWVEGLSEARQTAVCSMAFQMGINGLLQFHQSLATLKSGDYAKAADMFMDSGWAQQTPNRAKRVCQMIRQG